MNPPPPKVNTPTRDGHSAFRHSPYPRPQSTRSLPSAIPSVAKSGKIPSTKRVSLSTGGSSRLDEILNGLDAESTLHGSSVDVLRTHRQVAKYNFAVRGKELDLQREENMSKHANAEADYQRQANLKRLNIQKGKQKERTLNKKLRLMNLRIQLAQLKSKGGPINVDDEDMEDDDFMEDDVNLEDDDLGDMSLGDF